MKKTKEIKSFSLPKSKSLGVFAFVFIFWWSFLSGVNFGKTDIFHDKDQDGLSDEEEVMYGTDINNPDTDGDGYRDGVEVEAGFDPLKAAPGDKIIFGVKTTEKESDFQEEVNLTDEFFKKLSKEKETELAVLGDYYKNPEEYQKGENLDTLNEMSFTSEELQQLINQTTVEGAVNEMELISEDEIKVLSEVTGSERKKKEKEKKQIEEYLTKVMYITASNKPFAIEDKSSISQLSSGYVVEISSALSNGKTDKVLELKQKSQKIYEDSLEIETPYVLKDIHIKTLSLIKYLNSSININKLTNQEDPLAVALYIGKLQAALIEGENIKTEMEEILEEYEIESFGE